MKQPLARAGDVDFGDNANNVPTAEAGVAEKDMATTGNQLVTATADHNSNSCLGDTLGQYWANKELGSVPTSIYISSLPNAKDLSYDDLSKNYDANLAEIDMETFRTEDILTLPVIYSGNFQCSSLGEQCASMSGSLLSALDESSANISAPTSSEEEEEIFAKNGPLFSPIREPPQYCTISVDSLDSMEDNHDLLVTKKNNYTIVFEGSQEESDYLEVCGTSSSDGDLSFSWKRANREVVPSSDSMVRSDLAYTTWGKLRRATHTKGGPSSQPTTTSQSTVSSYSPKSQSLPNLLRHSLIVENFTWPIEQNGCVRLFDLVQNDACVAPISNPHNISLLKLYMKQKSVIYSNSESEEQLILCGSSSNSLINENSKNMETNNNTIKDTNSLYLEDSLMGHHGTLFNQEFKQIPIREEDELSTTDVLTQDQIIKPKEETNFFGIKKTQFSVFTNKNVNAVQAAMRETHLDVERVNIATQTHVKISDLQNNINGNSRESTCSSGYISSRFHQLSPSLKKSAQVIIERPCCRSTQIPIHIRDQAVQTSLSLQTQQPHSTQTSADKMEPSDGISKRAIYVCYPNYSLPDLSFLQEIGNSDDKIYLTPQKDVLTEPLKVRRRPKSCTDANSEPTSHHIRDWDSLSLLIPEELKNAILRLSLSHGGGSKQRFNSPSPVRRTSPTPIIQAKKSNAFLKKSSPVCTNAPKKGTQGNSKKRSLQKPAIHYKSSTDSSTTTISSFQAKPIQFLQESLADLENQEDLPPQEFAITPTSPASPPADVYQQEINKKSRMVHELQEAVKTIVKHFENAKDKKEKIRLGNGSLTPAIVPKVIHGFCNALEAILSDGLQPFIPGLFGMTSNNLWHLIEASTKQGECKKEIKELASKVNASEGEHKNKPTSFLIGLLNAGELEWWLGHLLGAGEVLAGHFYQPGAFIRLIALPGLTHLRGELQGMVAPLTSLPFHINTGNISLTRPPPPVSSASHATWDLTGPLALHHHTGEQLWPGVTVYPFLPRQEPAEYKFQKLRQKWEQMSAKEIKVQPPTFKTPAISHVAKDYPLSKKSTKPPISPKKPISEGQHSSRSSIPRSKFHHLPQSAATERSSTPRRSLIPVHKSAVGRRSSSLGKE